MHDFQPVNGPQLSLADSRVVSKKTFIIPKSSAKLTLGPSQLVVASCWAAIKDEPTFHAKCILPCFH